MTGEKHQKKGKEWRDKLQKKERRKAGRGKRKMKGVNKGEARDL